MASVELNRKQIIGLFHALNEKLKERERIGELYLVGGAVMCLVFETRPSTQDIDAYFQPTSEIRDAAKEIANEHDLSDKWLNDAVKGFLSKEGSYDSFLDLSNLKVFAAQPEYLLAMKCLSMRLGPEFHDESDVRYLLRFLNVETYQDAVTIITRYYPLERFPQKTLYALEEIVGLPKKIRRSHRKNV